MCKLIVVTNRALCEGDLTERIRMLARAGVDRIVLREKDLDGEAYEALARRALDACAGFKTACILHKDIRAAQRLKNYKIHLPLPVAEENREVLRDFETVGISVHSKEQLAAAQDCGADYVFYGHVFATDCKKDAPPRGLDALAQICGEAKVPVYAIGGITPQNWRQAIESGAAGICVMSYAMQKPEAEVRALVQACHAGI